MVLPDSPLSFTETRHKVVAVLHLVLVEFATTSEETRAAPLFASRWEGVVCAVLLGNFSSLVPPLAHPFCFRHQTAASVVVSMDAGNAGWENGVVLDEACTERNCPEVSSAERRAHFMWPSWRREWAAEGRLRCHSFSGPWPFAQPQSFQEVLRDSAQVAVVLQMARNLGSLCDKFAHILGAQHCDSA